MSDRHPHPDPDHPSRLASRDPVSIQLYLRDLRYSYLKAIARKFFLFPSRFIAKRVKSSRETTGKEIPNTSAARALITNLTAMR